MQYKIKDDKVKCVWNLDQLINTYTDTDDDTDTNIIGYTCIQGEEIKTDTIDIINKELPKYKTLNDINPDIYFWFKNKSDLIYSNKFINYTVNSDITESDRVSVVLLSYSFINENILYVRCYPRVNEEVRLVLVSSIFNYNNTYASINDVIDVFCYIIGNTEYAKYLIVFDDDRYVLNTKLLLEIITECFYSEKYVNKNIRIDYKTYLMSFLYRLEQALNHESSIYIEDESTGEEIEDDLQQELEYIGASSINDLEPKAVLSSASHMDDIVTEVFDKAEEYTPLQYQIHYMITPNIYDDTKLPKDRKTIAEDNLQTTFVAIINDVEEEFPSLEEYVYQINKGEKGRCSQWFYRYTNAISLTYFNDKVVTYSDEFREKSRQHYIAVTIYINKDNYP